MGKNKNKTKKSQPAAEVAPTEEAQMEPQQILTPLEKAQQYKDMQYSVFKNFIHDFEEEERSLGEEPQTLDKQRDLEKREREELKRLEKQVFKKDQQEVEEAYGNANAKLLRDRIAKTIADIQKQQKVHTRAEIAHAEVEVRVAKVKQDIQVAMNKKTMLNKLCVDLLERNFDLFLKHEQMLEEERLERQKLAANFGDQMKEVQAELDVQKSQRQQEIDENGELRKMIQAAIDGYRKKDEAYRAKMESHGKTVTEIERKLKETIDGTIPKTIKEAETEKARFMKACDNVKELSTKINGYMAKFDQIKEEMGDNSRKFEQYQAQVETKKLEIRTLETEIENAQFFEKRFQKVTTVVNEERKQLVAQVSVMRNLGKALKDQLKNLEQA